MATISNLFDPPRFRGCPPICPAANLPAFDDRASIGAYVNRHCPGHEPETVWPCATCGKWHFKTAQAEAIPAEVRASIRARATKRAAVAGPVKRRKEKELSLV